jgi:hypothetical protein
MFSGQVPGASSVVVGSLEITLPRQTLPHACVSRTPPVSSGPAPRARTSARRAPPDRSISQSLSATLSLPLHARTDPAPSCSQHICGCAHAALHLFCSTHIRRMSFLHAHIICTPVFQFHPPRAHSPALAYLALLARHAPARHAGTRAGSIRHRGTGALRQLVPVVPKRKCPATLAL